MQQYMPLKPTKLGFETVHVQHALATFVSMMFTPEKGMTTSENLVLGGSVVMKLTRKNCGKIP